jgi:crotonobetaine/carnitine-CoA ligase
VFQHDDVGAAWSKVGSGTVIELVVDACRRNPNVPAMAFEDGPTLTCQELLDAVEQFAGYLRRRCSPGERIAIMMRNRAEFMIVWIASMAARTTLVSVNTAFQEEDASHVISDSDAALIIAEDEFRPVVEKVRQRCRSVREVIYVSAPEPYGLAQGSLGGRSLRLGRKMGDRGDIANIYYTSGSTGPPKGCMLDHEYWLRFADVFLRLYDLGPTDRLLCCLQFFYGDPPWQLVAALRAGAPLIVMRRFSVSRFFPVVREHRVSALFSIASIPTLLLKAPPSLADRGHSVRFGVHLGIPPNLHSDFHRRWGFPWVEGYGLTETGLVVAMPLDLGDEMEGRGSIGIPCPEVSIRIADEAGAELPAGETGEILVQAPGIMRGYLNRPDATEEVLRGGWFHTGDLAWRDERGFLYFVGRIKDLIRRNGVNIAAAEVEQVLRAHPKVLDAAVVPAPDELRGEEVKAFLVPVDASEPPQMHELSDFCASRLASFKVPRFVELCSEFPRTPSMRVKKEALRALPAVGAATWDREAS